MAHFPAAGWRATAGQPPAGERAESSGPRWEARVPGLKAEGTGKKAAPVELDAGERCREELDFEMRDPAPVTIVRLVAWWWIPATAARARQKLEDALRRPEHPTAGW